MDGVVSSKDLFGEQSNTVSTQELFGGDQKSALSRSAIIAHNTDSDKYAQNRKAMTDKGIPESFASPANKPPSMDGMLSTIKDFLGLSGKTAEHMSDPDFAKVAKDDHPVLTRLEDMVTGFPKRLYGAVEAGESIVSGIGGAIGGAATGLTTLALTKGDTEAAKAVQEGVSNVLTYHPMTEVGKEYTEMAEKIAAIPSYVGHELSEEVAQQWNAPEWLRYIFNTAGDFGGYALADVAVRGAGAHIKNVVDTAKESKLKARDPEQFKTFVQDVAGDSTVQAPLAVVDDILTKAKTTPEEALSDPTAYYEQKFEGMASDTPVKADIPIQDVATLSDHITPEHINDMSVKGIPSLNEAEALKAEEQAKTQAEGDNAVAGANSKDAEANKATPDQPPANVNPKTSEELQSEIDSIDINKLPTTEERSNAITRRANLAKQLVEDLKPGDVVIDETGDIFGTVEYSDKTGITFKADERNPNGMFLPGKNLSGSFIPDRNYGTRYSVKKAGNKAQEGKAIIRPTHKQAVENAKNSAKEREAKSFQETQDKFAEEAASTETITEREIRRKREAQEGKQPITSESIIPESGQPFEFSYIRNTEKSSNMGKRFGQDVEPTGEYMTVGNPENIKNNPKMKSGVIKFDNPLVIDFGGGYGEPTNWKNILSEKYDGKTGKELSKAIQKDGYDGIVTISKITKTGEPYTSEIVSLKSENKAQEAKPKGLSAEMKGADETGKPLSEQTPDKTGDLSLGSAAAGFKPKTSDIDQLSSAIPEGKAQVGIFKNTISDTMQTIKGIKDSTINAFTAMKDVGQKIWDSYRKPPEWTGFKEMLGDYQLSREKSGIEASKFVKKIQDSIPKDVQEKITMWIDSGGKTELPAEYKTLAENVRNYFASRADQAIEAGVIDHAVENYVHRIWDRNSKISKQVTAETNAGMFQQNPKLAKRRVLSSISEGESLGLNMKDKRIGYLLTAYDSSLNEAIAARGFIKSLLNGKAKDGRALVDISGSGKQVPKEGIPDSYIIKPKTKPAESVDYKPIDHPALRKWKWAGNDALGNPILMQGDLVVHPEIYKHMKNILGKSEIREFEVAGRRPGEALLNGIQELKGTLLSLSGFHQVQEGVHAVGHEVNPFNTKEIDLNDPLQADLVKHGVMVYSHNAMQDFSEGVYASGLVTKIPVIGRQMQAYGEYLFQGYIPRLKMEMARQAYERNTKRYKGKLNDDQIKELTAKEANAAFGEQNYVMMGRNKTLQDMFRLVALAPDFLESRAKFVGQALKPYGREQMAALLRLSAYMAVAAQVTNYFVNGETDWSQPFSAKINGKYYTLRSVPGDLIHLVTDPRSFSYHRLNPSTTKPLVEGLTGRNIFGQKQDIYSQMGDWIKGFTPIPLQGLVMDKNDMTLLDSILQSTGIGSRKAKTPAETKASELLGNRIPVGQTQEQKKQSFAHRQIVDAFRKNKPLNEDQRDAYAKMTEAQKKNIDKESEMLPIQVAFSHLTVDEAKVVWKKMSNKEKLQVGEIYDKKIDNAENKE